MDERRILFVGLGNPGAEYAATRHNIGFMALDTIQRYARATPWRARFQGMASEAVIGESRVLLLKPMTYMNESGRSVGEAMRFFKIAIGDIVAFHDELDLEPGRLRMKTAGGHAGHNGLRSLHAHVGAEYRRVRMGIGHPGDKALVTNYVLGPFAKAERPWVEDLCDACARHATLLAAGDDGHFQSKVHIDMQARNHPA